MLTTKATTTAKQHANPAFRMNAMARKCPLALLSGAEGSLGRFFVVVHIANFSFGPYVPRDDIDVHLHIRLVTKLLSVPKLFVVGL
uniref:Uncharacterized protein n=1 Tax=Panagrellus redivivus TaxID=6233 RepID=A0A7E4VCX9_PANRE